MAASATRQTVEYRFYEIPQDVPVLALLGDHWIRPYGEMGLAFLHFHNILEIGYCYEGTGMLALENQIVPYGPGVFSIIPQNICHTTVSDHLMCCRNEYLFIDTEGFVNSLPEEERRFGQKLLKHVYRAPIVLHAADNPALHDAILALIREMRSKQRFYQISVKGLLLTLLIEIAREDMCREDLTDTETPIGHKQSLLISAALNDIETHYGDTLRISALAEHCHMSETHFRRLFKAVMKISPLEYINIVRVEMACNLLRTTEYNMEIISSQVGYTSISSFERNFHQVTGLTPTQWRKSPENYEQKLRNYQIAPFQGWR
ncbi:MAG: AraC family transcriptional regulator [Clostridia bacterium]